MNSANTLVVVLVQSPATVQSSTRFSTTPKLHASCSSEMWFSNVLKPPKRLLGRTARACSLWFQADCPQRRGVILRFVPTFSLDINFLRDVVLKCRQTDNTPVRQLSASIFVVVLVRSPSTVQSYAWFCTSGPTPQQLSPQSTDQTSPNRPYACCPGQRAHFRGGFSKIARNGEEILRVLSSPTHPLSPCTRNFPSPSPCCLHPMYPHVALLWVMTLGSLTFGFSHRGTRCGVSCKTLKINSPTKTTPPVLRTPTWITQSYRNDTLYPKSTPLRTILRTVSLVDQ